MTFFGMIKHLLKLTSSDIQLNAPVQNNITLSGRNELNIGVGLVQ